MKVPANTASLIAALERLSTIQQRRYLVKSGRGGTYKRFLYKYRAINPDNAASIDQLRTIIVDSQFWLSSPLAFNDPFDMSFRLIFDATYDEQKARFEAIVRTHSTRMTARERRYKVAEIMARPHEMLIADALRAKERTMATVGVCSFAGNAKSILMWSHYAGDHKGICLQFELTKDLPNLVQAVGVDYQEEYPTVNWWRRDHHIHDLRRALLRKDPCWRYEEERRLFVPGQASTKIPFNPEALVGVILGCRCTPEIRAVINNLLKEREGRFQPPVRLYDATTHDSRYRLVIRRSTS